jgi:hypothetical protein
MTSSRLHPGLMLVDFETVEHLTTAETDGQAGTQRVPRSLARSTGRDSSPQHADRSRKMQSPLDNRRPLCHPGRSRNRVQAVRDGIIVFVEQSTEDLRATEVTHPHPAAGVVSTYEMLIIMAKHAERHAAQIEETRRILDVRLRAATRAAEGPTRRRS